MPPVGFEPKISAGERQDSSGRVISSSQRLLPDNTYKRKTSMPPAGFEPTISVGEWPENHALDRAATETGITVRYPRYINKI